VSNIVLDTSALLAAFFGEPGSDRVDTALASGALLSAVNAAEVVSKLVDRGMPADQALSMIVAAMVEIVPFDLEQARASGELRATTRHLGLSFSDRACLALATLYSVPAMTADRAWSSISGVAVILIRNTPEPI
jgi:PIN domain nuclease of toxin-antitoxin system